MKTGFGGAACATVMLLVCSAAAADDQSWSGFYLGAHGAYYGAEFDVLNNPASPTTSVEGALLGLTAGFGHQFDRVVLGIEGDWAWGDLNQVLRDGNFLTLHTAVSSVATVRLRAGWDAGDVMPFVTAGMIWTDVEAGSICPAGAGFGVCALTGPFSVFGSEVLEGWTYGVGGEYRIAPQWTLKGEVLWTSFEDVTSTVTWPVVGTFPVVSEQSTDPIVRLGVNWRL